MISRKLFVAAMLCGVPAVFAAEEALPKAEALLDRYVEVTGGKAAYEKHKTEIATGTLLFSAQGIKGTIVRYAAAPDKYYSTLDIAGIGKIEMGVSDGVAWESSSVLGPRIRTGDEKAQAIREATMHSTLNWRKLYTKAETVGTDMVNGELCYKVVLTPAEGKPEVLYLEKKSGLEVQMTTTASSPMGELPVVVTAGDYKNFGGVLIPTAAKQKSAGQEFTITIENVKVNEPIPPERFALPAEVKAIMAKGGAK